MSRVSEVDLVIPALYIVYTNTSCSTSTIKEELIKMFNPTGEDAKILSGRKDSKFTQIVRNLTGSHYSTNEFGKYTKKIGAKFSLTDDGVLFLKDKISQCSYIDNNNFSYDEKLSVAEKINNSSKHKHSLLTYFEDDKINEGKSKNVSSKVKTRSDKLRKAAIQYYSDKRGHIYCCICGFDFQTYYGDIGKDYIQIHHEHPVCQYDDEGVETFLAEAVKNVKPLCANCHCMIHRDRNNPMTISELKTLIK